MKEKYRQALEEVLQNLRSIDSPNQADGYIDNSIKIIVEVLREEKKEVENE